MHKFVIITSIVAITLAISMIVFPDLSAALLLTLIPTAVGLFVFRRYTDEKGFITKIFLISLLLRLGFGVFVHIFELRDFFGGDANTYDHRAMLVLDQWSGKTAVVLDPFIRIVTSTSTPGWGMTYLVASIYFLIGHNILAAQSFCAVFGAATAPMVYFCANKMFQNKRLAKTAAIIVAVFPALIIWSGQLLKDGLILFLLVLTITMVLQLQERLSLSALILLGLSLVVVLTLRFYIFYMLAAAVAGSFLVGVSHSSQSLLRRTGVLVMLGLGMTYFGITRDASVEFEKFGNLERVQNSRRDLARSGESGFEEDVDVSTTRGAISVIPVGLVYLMLAPFPWEVANLRQSITLPEIFVWWAMIPLMIWGIWWTIRHRVRSAFPILIFSLMLTLAYSVFQGNVGTAYRQRTQIQVFLFIFFAVGWELWRERRENQKILRRIREHQIERAVKARVT